MKRDDYEKIRSEVAKKYKDRIAELEMQVASLNKSLVEETNARFDAEQKMRYWKAKYDAVPEYMQRMVGLAEVMNNL